MAERVQTEERALGGQIARDLKREGIISHNLVPCHKMNEN